MLELIKAIFPPVLRYSAMRPDQWRQWHDPLLDDLQPNEHGIVRQMSSEAVRANGLILDFEGEGFINVRVN